MLRKLMKHELRATGRVMGPMLLITLLTAVGANLSIRWLLNMRSTLANVLGGLLLVAAVAASLGVWVMAFVLMIRRFYRNLLRDEGYLMMTLPVSVHKQILSKALVSVLWFAVALVTVVLGMLIVAADVSLVRAIGRGLEELMALLRENGMSLSEHAITMLTAIGLWMPVLLVLGGISMCLQFYAAMAIGHSFSAHKGAMSVAAYIALQIALGMLSKGLAWLLRVTGAGALISRMLEQMRYGVATNVALLGAALAAVLLAAALHMITAYFLTRRLNLE
ncbi:MAG: hypothetical protein ACI4PG_03315 [Candidatus Ventricola sp.]